MTMDPGAPPPSSSGQERSKLNLDVNLAGALCYLFLCLSGFVFFLLETEHRRIRFHALQSLLLFSLLWVLQVMSMMLSVFAGGYEIWMMLNGLVALTQFVLWLVLVIRTFQGHTIVVPVVGQFAAKTVGWAG